MVSVVDLDPASVHDHYTSLQVSRGAMGPEKELLVELDKRFDGLEKKLDSTADSSSSRLEALENAAKVFDEWRPSVGGVIDDLCGELNKLSSLKLEVGKIVKYMEHTMVDAPISDPGVYGPVPTVLVPPPSPKPLSLTKSSSAPPSPSSSIHDAMSAVTPTGKSSGADASSAAPHPSAVSPAHWPSGHYVGQWNWAGEYGVVTTIVPPSKGTFPCRHLPLPPGSL